MGLTAQEADIQMSADNQHIKMIAKQNVTVEATEKMALTAKTASLTGRESAGLLSPDTVDVGQGTTVNVSAAVINQS